MKYNRKEVIGSLNNWFNNYHLFNFSACKLFVKYRPLRSAENITLFFAPHFA